MTTLSCPVADRCGGCPLIGQHEQRQRRFKSQALTAALRDHGLPEMEIGWISDGRVGAYRNRIRLELVDGEPRFFNPHKLQKCAVLHDSLRELLLQFVQQAKRHKRLLECCLRLELRAADADGKRGLSLFTSEAQLESLLSEPLPELVPDCLTHVHAWPKVARAKTSQGGARCEVPTQRFMLTDSVYCRVPLGSFMQVNWGVNRMLVEQVLRLASKLESSSFVDLFCGSGNFSLPLLHHGLSGAGVESDRAAMGALWQAAHEQRLDAAHFLAGDAREPKFLRADLVIIDPPRAGLRGRVERVAELASRHIILCYCDADSFARDAAALEEHGFSVLETWAVEMFPQTAHIEVLALLERTGS